MVIVSIESTVYTNRHFTFDSNGNAVQHLVYISEPLGHPAIEGYGWPRFEFEQVVGEGQYILKRKLGWGMSCSIWLAYDQVDARKDRYVAIKALTGYQNLLSNYGRSHEFDALQAVTVTREPSPHCLSIYGAFSLSGKVTDGHHICYVTPLLGGNVAELLNHLPSRPPFRLVKRIILHTLRGLAHTHQRGYVHTDLKLDNIFFSTKMSAQDVKSLLETDPPRLHDPEYSPDGIVQVAVSQPLPCPSLEDAMECTFLLGDYGHANFEVSPRPNHLSPTESPSRERLSRPVERKGGHMGVWMPGKLKPTPSSSSEPARVLTREIKVFELVTGRMLFDWDRRPADPELNPEVNLLYQMMNVTGERFSPIQLSEATMADQYFDKDGDLLSKPPYVDDNYTAKMRGLVHEVCDVDVASTCGLLSRCLRLNPEDRSPAADLLSDPFFIGSD
ncbi:hypothetical protein C0993_004157 [Termitomyces sp. T159_Od127]|nr:hypothetical protein C0993_004157 [Termitomyces sp. T159_Od127]